MSFIGRAGGDTALAGPGPMTSDADGKQRTIFGQVVRVERLGAEAARLLGQGARSQAMDIVVVPWGYDAGCSPLVWDQSARWTPVDTRGLFTGRLRDRADWIGGRPTIDVSVAPATPYMGVAPRYRTVTRNPTTMAPEPALTLDELLNLYDLLPYRSRGVEDLATVHRSIEPLMEWARDHPDLVTRFPAREILDEIRGQLRAATRTPPHSAKPR